MKQASVSLVLNAPRKDGTFTVAIRVTYNRTPYYYSTGVSMSQKEFEAALKIGAKSRNAQKIKKEYERACAIVDELTPFSREGFKMKFKGEAVKAGTPTPYELSELIESEWRDKGKVKTAKTYLNSRRSLQKIRPSLRWEEVNTKLLRSWEAHILDKSRPTTASMYIRTFKAVINRAVKEGYLKDNPTPDYSPPKWDGNKRALSLGEVRKLLSVPVEGTTALHRDYWLFLLLCNGMNPTDFAHLKRSNIQAGMIHFQRAKTLDSAPLTIRVAITDQIQSLLDAHSHKGEYLFPILEKGMNAAAQEKAVHNLCVRINWHMSKIAKTAGVEKATTTYVARHTFTMLQLKSGADLVYIQEALGHMSFKTTRNYVGSLEESTIKERGNALGDLLKGSGG